MKSTFVYLGLGVLVLAGSSILATPVEEPDFRIDARVELASVLCRLAGYPEFQDMAVPAYDKAVNDYFGRYRDHPAVRLTARLRKERDFGYNAVPDLALIASDARSWKARVPLHPLPSFLDSRWDEASARQFLKAAGDFARDTRADVFFRTQEPILSGIERAHKEQFTGRLDLAWYRNHFDMPKGTTFHVIPAPLSGAASYGIRVILPGGALEVNAVLAVARLADGEAISISDDACALIVHEFCHSFVNPWVDAHAESLRPAGERLFAAMQQTFTASAYSSWKTMMYESLVRAAAIRYSLDHGNPTAVNFNLLDDRAKGFWWTEDLARVFPENRIVTLDALEPEIRAFLSEWAADPAVRIAAKKAEIASRGPQIVSFFPRDGDSEVDSGAAVLEIRFDRPMGRSLSVMGDSPDLTGKPAWDETKTVVRFPVLLRPGERYVMFLNKDGNGFKSEAGEPLSPQVWRFQVKQ